MIKRQNGIVCILSLAEKKLQIYVKLPQVIVLGMCAIILHQNNKKVGISLYVQTLRFVA